eukprot:gene2486-3195_t
MEQVFWDNIILIGFDINENEKKYKIKFNENMFKKPNPTGLFVLLHFLFTKLNSKRTKRDFNGIWPLDNNNSSKDKFLQISCDWLSELDLMKNIGNQESNKIFKSNLKSCHGTKLYHILWSFSALILRKMTNNSFCHDNLLNESSTKMTSQVLQLHLKQKCELFMEKVQMYNDIQNEWKLYSEKLYKEYKQQKKEKILNEETVENLKKIESFYQEYIQHLTVDDDYHSNFHSISFKKIINLNSKLKSYTLKLSETDLTNIIENDFEMKSLFKSQLELIENLKKLSKEMESIIKEEEEEKKEENNSFGSISTSQYIDSYMDSKLEEDENMEEEEEEEIEKSKLQEELASFLDAEDFEL